MAEQPADSPPTGPVAPAASDGAPPSPAAQAEAAQTPTAASAAPDQTQDQPQDQTQDQPQDQPQDPAPSPATPPSTAPPSEEAPLDPNLLGAGEGSEAAAPARRPPPERRPEPRPTEEEDPEAVRAYYRQLYRPASNPLDISGSARAAFTLLDGRDEGTSGRIAHLSGTLWFRWNVIGVGLTGTLLACNVQVGEDRPRRCPSSAEEVQASASDASRSSEGAS